MTLSELSSYFDSFLHLSDFPADPSRNGIQIANSSPDKKQISKIAFAVDACEDTALKAAGCGAQMLFVHHGIFWGDCTPVTGIQYKRISAFLKNDIALYAAHIPLDANLSVGNNAGIAKRIGLTQVEQFGTWRGMTLGVIGKLPSPATAEELAAKLAIPDARILPFGKKEISTVAIISGGAGEDFEQAVTAGADAYITGEVSHEDFHPIEESGITVIAGGHYNTETFGVNLVREKLEAEKGIETVFIDMPTGL